MPAPCDLRMRAKVIPKEATRELWDLLLKHQGNASSAGREVGVTARTIMLIVDELGLTKKLKEKFPKRRIGGYRMHESQIRG